MRTPNHTRFVICHKSSPLSAAHIIYLDLIAFHDRRLLPKANLANPITHLSNRAVIVHPLLPKLDMPPVNSANSFKPPHIQSVEELDFPVMAQIDGSAVLEPSKFGDVAHSNTQKSVFPSALAKILHPPRNKFVEFLRTNVSFRSVP